ncbi:BamA/TamA family outer membrane protein [Flavihumibacter sp. CACIAM 22H1]|uniref:BamA/TamA family outer membrane protein n=1 Tax=Flavihumibacter sp. CACIAM 22H1 TaxID=1812911 RepID=UPI0007A843F2|nr:BamA/TamA family outer membrane protein [Flavihumibacter sp. CACIAM 22H1]KYP15716.1 MAG: hypothetical protein A1D16_19335 [Flavihumibacter sp. CACIAM 22H1]
MYYPFIRLLLLWVMLAGAALFSYAQTDSLVTEVLLIGDAGEFKQQRHPVLDAMRQKRTGKTPKAAALFFLGDNSYPVGLPDPGDPRFNRARSILDTQWTAGLQLAEQVYFLPGNHDWAKGHSNGLNQVKNQGDYIRTLENPGVNFLPADGCPGPELIQLNEQVSVVMMDSQWWLQQFEKPGISSDCDCKTPEEFLFRLQEILNQNRHKIILFLSHHPFVSAGIHGGYYQFKQHFFPLTDLNKKLYLPLPVIGSLYPLLRGGFGNIQDIQHPQYQQMSSRVDTILASHPAVIRIAGHEHGLQHIIRHGNHYIISGGGSKATRHRTSIPGRTSFSTTGYAVLQLYKSGISRLIFWEATETAHKEIYTQVLPLHLAEDVTISGPFTLPRWPDSVQLAAAPYFKAGSLKKWFFGSNYRKEWITPVTVPTISIRKEKGGLTPVKRGGGMQSRSLRLQDSTGREYVLRSIEKYPDKTLPEELRQTFVKDAIVDGISASYPYAALSIPRLAEAAGIPHTKPMLVYLPDDPALGPFQKDFGKQLYLFDTREPAELSKTYSTDKVLEALQKDNDNQVDQAAVLKARLLDMFIMDFDRHDDQWRWGRVLKQEGYQYYPIPRDRDQAFFVSQGKIPWLISRSWLLPKFQGFRVHAQNINTFNYNARYFDRSFLNKTNRSDWENSCRQLLAELTDSTIDRALADQPAEIRLLSAASIAATLKKRKAYLLQEALSYQAFLHRSLDIPGSSKKDWFELEWKKKGVLKLTIYDINKQGRPFDKLSEQLIDPTITKELRLYGLEGSDVFRISGQMPRKFTIRIISGEGNDSLIALQTGNKKHRLKWYDANYEQNHQAGKGLLLKKFSDRPAVHTYNRKSFHYNITAPLILAAYNRDDGLFLGAGIKTTHHAFRKQPYSYQHQFNAYYAVATGAYQFRYILDAPAFRFYANLKAPNNTRNFFGFGNQTKFIKNEATNITYYRSRFNLFELAALAKYQPAPSLLFNAGPIFQHYWIDYEDNKDRFITTPESGLDQERLQLKKSYLGLQVQAELDTRNNRSIPSRGVHWISTGRLVQGINNAARSFRQWESALSYYMALSSGSQLVLAGRIGGGGNYGNYEFFQAQYLGGNESLRGYRNFRFAGDHRLYNNLDLRIRLTELRGYILPGALGMMLFQDIGRVWWQGSSSRKWHLGYGAGLWVAPANRFVVAACYGKSDEGGLPFISLGFQF